MKKKSIKYKRYILTKLFLKTIKRNKCKKMQNKNYFKCQSRILMKNIYTSKQKNCEKIAVEYQYKMKKSIHFLSSFVFRENRHPRWTL